MKRILVLAMCILAICSCAVLASADDGGIYENAGDLYSAWVSQDCVPDYITGVWSTDGGHENLTFGVVKGDAGEMGRQDILALVQNDSSVTIVYQTYSRNYLYRIQKEIEETYFENGLGLVAAGVMERENMLRFEVHTDFANNADTQAMIRHVTDQYGDAVYFSYIDTYPQFVNGTQTAPTGPVLVMTNPQNQMIPFGFVFGLCVIVLAFFFLIEMPRRRTMAITTTATPVVMDEHPLSEQEVKEAIRKAEVMPPESLDDRVMHSIQSDN